RAGPCPGPRSRPREAPGAARQGRRRLIAGRYQELENGLARDTELDRVVRLRWVDSASEVDDPRLSHPNVVRVFDIGEHDGFRRGEPGADVRGLAEALNDAAPDLPPLTADTTTGLALELERARPTAPAPTIPFSPVGSRPPPSRRLPLAAVVAAVAFFVVVVG